MDKRDVQLFIAYCEVCGFPNEIFADGNAESGMVTVTCKRRDPVTKVQTCLAIMTVYLEH